MLRSISTCLASGTAISLARLGVDSKLTETPAIPAIENCSSSFILPAMPLLERRVTFR